MWCLSVSQIPLNVRQQIRTHIRIRIDKRHKRRSCVNTYTSAQTLVAFLFTYIHIENLVSCCYVSVCVVVLILLIRALRIRPRVCVLLYLLSMLHRKLYRLWALWY